MWAAIKVFSLVQNNPVAGGLIIGGVVGGIIGATVSLVLLP
jgi:hypothetical protein